MTLPHKVLVAPGEFPRTSERPALRDTLGSLVSPSGDGGRVTAAPELPPAPCQAQPRCWRFSQAPALNSVASILQVKEAGSEDLPRVLPLEEAARKDLESPRLTL